MIMIPYLGQALSPAQLERLQVAGRALSRADAKDGVVDLLALGGHVERATVWALDKHSNLGLEMGGIGVNHLRAP